MKYLMSAEWWKAAGIRAAKTMFQTGAALVVTQMPGGSVDWMAVGSAVIVAGVASLGTSDEDALIGILLSSAEQMCKDVGRLSEDQWEAVNAADRDAENGVQPTRELEALRSTCRVAILYALGYLYEHRDEADHHQLMLTLRSILFAVREGVF